MTGYQSKKLLAKSRIAEPDDLVKQQGNGPQWLLNQLVAANLRIEALEAALRKISELEYKYAAINGAAYRAHKIASAALAGENTQCK